MTGSSEATSSALAAPASDTTKSRSAQPAAADDTTPTDNAAALPADTEELPARQNDPSRPGRSVKYKKQNVAFLRHQRWKEEQAAKGPAPEPIELPSPVTLLKWTLLLVISILAVGQFVTGDVLYGYEGRWRNPRRWLPVPQRSFTMAELALYDGKQESRPVYVSS